MYFNNNNANMLLLRDKSDEDEACRQTKAFFNLVFFNHNVLIKLEIKLYVFLCEI